MTDVVMKQHYVTFFSPGTFFSEQNTEEVDSWDVEKAKEMAKSIKQRYGAVPYSFYFFTKGRSEKDLDSKVIESSPMYFLGGTHGRLLSLAEVKAQNDSNNKILISNMENNGYSHVYQTTEGWKTTTGFEMGKDILLD